MRPPNRVMDRLRALRHDWRLWLQPRTVAVMIALAGGLFLAFGSALLGPAREGLPALSRQPARLLAGTVAQARDVFTGSGDEAAASTEVVATEAGPGGQEPLRPSDPVATLGDSNERLTVAEVRDLVEEHPERARELVFLPGVTVREATVILDRPPTPAQMPARPEKPSPTTTTGTSTTTTTRPRSPRVPPWSPPLPWPGPTQPPATVPEPTVPEPTVPDPTVPDPTVPDPTVPDPTVPDPTIPDPTVPDPTVPDPTIPEPTVPDPTVPEPTIPPETVPDPTLPPVELPPVELPDIEMPDIGF